MGSHEWRPSAHVRSARSAGAPAPPCGRRTSGSLTETRVCDWQDWPERFDGSADQTMTPCPLDGTDQRARTVLAAGVEPDGPVDADAASRRRDVLTPPGLRDVRTFGGGRTALPSCIWARLLVASVFRPSGGRCRAPPQCGVPQMVMP